MEMEMLLSEFLMVRVQHVRMSRKKGRRKNYVWLDMHMQIIISSIKMKGSLIFMFLFVAFSHPIFYLQRRLSQY